MPRNSVARYARVIIPGCPTHITHRGNRGGSLFFSRLDREMYLKWLRLYSDRYGVGIWAYCLMTNHVHLIAVGRRTDSIANAIGGTHMRFARWTNRQHGWSGHLWANRYFSTPLDEAHLWCAVKYVELNPVRAGLVRRASNYAWSSARAHCAAGPNNLLDPSRPFPGPIGDWSAWLSLSEDEGMVARLRERTQTGRPCGSDGFLARLETRLGRRLSARTRGPLPRTAGK